MSGLYLYCQNPDCGEYLGSLGGNDCYLCGWCSGRKDDEQPDEPAESEQS